MKKTKIMLASIAVLAVVGSALAFKARTLGDFHFCTSAGTAGKCPNNTDGQFTINPLAQGESLYITFTANCDDDTNCDQLYTKAGEAQ